MEPLIQFKDFTFKYDAQAEPTLKSLNLSIEKGQKVLQVPDGQFIGLTVAEDLGFALENDCLPLDQMTDKINYWANKLDLTAFLDSRPQDLSGGQKQRMSLAGVLIDESPILLFDEPLSNLDPKSGQETIELIDRIHQEGQTTTIIIEHRLEDVLYRQVDKVILINDGQILFDGHPDDLLKTNLLVENGIREPLYVTALKDLNVDVTKAEHLSDLSQLDLSDITVAGLSQSANTVPKDPILEVKQLKFSYQENQP